MMRSLPTIRVQVLHGLHCGLLGTLVRWEVMPSPDGRQRCWVLIDGDINPYCYPRDSLTLVTVPHQQGAAA